MKVEEFKNFIEEVEREINDDEIASMKSQLKEKLLKIKSYKSLLKEEEQALEQWQQNFYSKFVTPV